MWAQCFDDKITYIAYIVLRNSVLYIGLLKRMRAKMLWEEIPDNNNLLSIPHTNKNENLFLPKCFVVATRFPVGTIFANEWFVRVAGGLCTTVSATGITTAGVPFNDCATWVVVADKNLEKPGDKHLVENILDERFQAKNSRCFDEVEVLQYGRQYLRHVYP